MRLRLRCVTTLAFAIAVSAPLVLPMRAEAQWAVIDHANLSQNILTAARALEQINNQIRSLQNQTFMLQNMALDLKGLDVSQLGGITRDLAQIGTLMNEAQGIGFNVAAVTSAYQQSYPQHYGAGTTISKLVGDAQSRWQNARDAFQQTMLVQSQIAGTVQSDTVRLASLVHVSQGASGNLEVTQATNQLLALSIKQQLQIETMMAAQGRADALAEANGTEAEEEGRAALETFLGSGNAYTP